MPGKKSPQLVKAKVIGARFTPNEQALIEIARGSRTASTWMADTARAELQRVKKKLEEDAQ